LFIILNICRTTYTINNIATGFYTSGAHLKDFNENIKAMAEAIGWEKQLTSNSLRHGLANHLNEANVDIKIIQEAMGHETQLKTQTNLDDIEDSLILKR
jgi:site-specific recombinase XerD